MSTSLVEVLDLKAATMEDNRDRSILLVTANVGSMFEQSTKLLPEWSSQFCQFVSQRRPDFLALHLQEVGGKYPTEAAAVMQTFLDSLLDCPEMEPFDCVRGYLDGEYQHPERFTALGSLYFIRSDVPGVSLWNFNDKCFHRIAGREVLTENLGENAFHYREKFPSEFSPHRLTRKGFILTRWDIGGQLFNFVNVHLYHDPDNLVAMELSPSSYAINRRKAILYSFERFKEYMTNGEASFFFGDFNFRLDLCQLVNDVYVNGCDSDTLQCHAENQQVMYSNPTTGEVVLQMAPKVFRVSDKALFQERYGSLARFDKETSNLGLFEQPVSFQPSYPLSESGEARQYMETRCPAWCDRILYNSVGRQIVGQDSTSYHSVDYGLVGLDSCMGDHKPVFLSFKTLTGSGGNTQSQELSQDLDDDSVRWLAVGATVAVAIALPLVLWGVPAARPGVAGVLCAGLPFIAYVAQQQFM